MKRLYISFLFSFFLLGGIQTSAQETCQFPHYIEEWNMKLCTDESMQHDLSRPGKILIHRDYLVGDELKKMTLEISSDYNYDNLSEEDLFYGYTMNLADTPYEPIRKDSILNFNEIRFYLMNESIFPEDEPAVTLISAVSRFENQWYTFQIFGSPEQTGEELLIDVVSTVKFEGVESMDIDTEAQVDFENYLLASFQDPSLIEKRLITYDILLNASPEEEKMKIEEDQENFEKTLSGWNDLARDFVKRMSNFNEIRISMTEFNADRSNPKATAYFGVMGFEADGQEIQANMMMVEAEGVMYLGLVKTLD